jgi:hypothetical protein
MRSSGPATIRLTRISLDGSGTASPQGCWKPAPSPFAPHTGVAGTAPSGARKTTNSPILSGTPASTAIQGRFVLLVAAGRGTLTSGETDRRDCPGFVKGAAGAPRPRQLVCR